MNVLDLEEMYQNVPKYTLIHSIPQIITRNSDE